MIPISTWYDRLGQHTFPTVFIALSEAECRLPAVTDDHDNEAGTEPAAARIIAALNQAIRSLPGRCFVGADVCAPTDSPRFRETVAVSTGQQAWELLRSSDKVRRALNEGKSSRLTVRPYRNMNRIREFRLFFYHRRLVAMSQMNLERHFARFARRQEQLWNSATDLAADIIPCLPEDNAAVDIYFCANGEIIVVDMNQWGEPTDPLLLRSWDQDWNREIGLKLIPPPINLQGNVSVSF